ncbi:hypothetical protein [Paenibacillus sp. yr247]|uniref:hypothetical protein n=1 Tax=Paenibacillus sp. yr247 TaxID=1761880 RepID=UPI0011405A4A
MVQIWACLYGHILESAWLYLYMCHVGLSLVQICGKVLGKWLGRLVALLQLAFVELSRLRIYSFCEKLSMKYSGLE